MDLCDCVRGGNAGSVPPAALPEPDRSHPAVLTRRDVSRRSQSTDALYTLKKIVLYSTKIGSWLIIILEPLLMLYSTISKVA